MSFLLRFLLIGLIFYEAESFSMEKPPGSKVNFGDVINGSQQISLSESRETYLQIVLITRSAKKPDFKLLKGDEEAFDFAFVHSPSGNDGEYLGILLNSVDYEQLNEKFFSVQVFDGVELHEFKLNILDVPNDEHPEFENIPLVCRMKAEIDIPKDDTPCIYKLSNPEGNLNDLVFNVLESVKGSGENEFFSMEHVKAPQKNDTVSEIALFLKKPLESLTDDRNSYKFDIQVLRDLNVQTCPWKRIPVVVLIVPEIIC